MHKPEFELAIELNNAEVAVPTGAFYSHYKTPEHIYQVIGHTVIEQSDEIGIIYRAQFGEYLSFVRSLPRWLEQVEWQGKTTPRFIQSK